MKKKKKSALSGFNKARMLKIEQIGGRKTEGDDGSKNLNSNSGPPSLSYIQFLQLNLL